MLTNLPLKEASPKSDFSWVFKAKLFNLPTILPTIETLFGNSILVGIEPLGAIFSKSFFVIESAVTFRLRAVLLTSGRPVICPFTLKFAWLKPLMEN